ncbi:MAG: hypothetical protein MI923_30625 [Phycisphaerales bacterium]|nr:hypothetical protein [Phycisphaerales bacterium]
MIHEEEQTGAPAGDGADHKRLAGTDSGKSKARKLFAHAKKAEDLRNYEYAVELYVQGLAHWPDAIDEGLKKLRVVATARKQQGGKPPNFMTRRKYSTSGKDVEQSLNNALHLHGLDPTDISYMEQILQLATKTHCDVVAQWIAPVMADTYSSAKKLSAGHYKTACEAMDMIAKAAREFGNDQGAMDILRANVAIAQTWARHYPDSSEPLRAQSNASGELAIVKGKFDRADDFTDSLKDADGQQDLRDRERLVHTEDRTKQLIARARQDWQANRDNPNKLLALATLMTKIESDENENDAIQLLESEYDSAGNYVFRQKADELRIRQLNRHRRELETKAKAKPDSAELKEQIEAHTRRQLEAETEIFEHRLKQYPTDLKIKFQLALRYFYAKRYDEAIPMFQQTVADGRVRAESRLYMGCCFYDKQFYPQAVETLRLAVNELESRTSSVAFALNYWLARALERSGEVGEAKKVYGHLIQLDYNYRDARQRLEKLVAADKS